MNVRTRWTGVALAAVAGWARPAGAQLTRDAHVEWQAVAGGEAERYLRALQLVGRVPVHQWALRGFSPREYRELTPGDTMHPWAGALTRGTARVRLLAPEGQSIFNSGFPFGANDGPVWAGKGLTNTVTAGLRATAGPFDVILAPRAFRSENASFPLQPNGLDGKLVFADGIQPRNIDLPQRFGNGAYQRIDAGESSVRASAGAFTGGLSTASEWWGPAVENPYLLGSNAGGFPHLFVGTARPVQLGAVRVHVRLIGGALQQSDYAVVTGPERGRSLGGAVASLAFNRLPGLEIGVGRLFENNTDSTSGVSDVLTSLFKNPFKVGRASALGTVTGDEPDNQLASAFFRWVFPRSGVEIYGEFGREDNSYDLRDLLVEPDQSGSYLLGFGRGLTRSGRRVLVMRAEVFDSRVSHLVVVRPQTNLYTHTTVTQGHTQRGQALAAPDGVGGGGAFLSLEELSPAGRRSIRLSRSVRATELPLQLGANARPADVLYALGGEWSTFHGRVDVSRELVAAYELNRGFNGDGINVRASLRARAHW